MFKVLEYIDNLNGIKLSLLIVRPSKLWNRTVRLCFDFK